MISTAETGCDDSTICGIRRAVNYGFFEMTCVRSRKKTRRSRGGGGGRIGKGREKKTDLESVFFRLFPTLPFPSVVTTFILIIFPSFNYPFYPTCSQCPNPFFILLSIPLLNMSLLLYSHLFNDLKFMQCCSDFLITNPSYTHV